MAGQDVNAKTGTEYNCYCNPKALPLWVMQLCWELQSSLLLKAGTSETVPWLQTQQQQIISAGVLGKINGRLRQFFFVLSLVKNLMFLKLRTHWF